MTEVRSTASDDYDNVNDIDIIVGSDNGNMTLLLNSLKIRKRTYPENVKIFGGKPNFGSAKPGPTKRIMITDSKVENPYARDMQEVDVQEIWKGNLTFVEDSYIIIGATGAIAFILYMLFFDTLVDTESSRFEFYLNFPNQVCVRNLSKRPPIWGCNGGKFTTSAIAALSNDSFLITGILDIFNREFEVKLRESFVYQYKVFVESSINITGITVVN